MIWHMIFLKSIGYRWVPIQLYRSKHRVGKLKEYCMQSTRSKNTSDCVWGTFQLTWDCPSWRQSVTPKISVWISYFWKRPRVNVYYFLRSPSIFDVWGHMRTLCPPTRHLARNDPIYRNYSPRVSFSVISVPRDLWGNSEMCVRERSLVTRLFLTQAGCLTLDVLENGPVPYLRRESSPPCVSESVKYWSLRTKKRPRPWWRHPLT